MSLIQPLVVQRMSGGIAVAAVLIFGTAAVGQSADEIGRINFEAAGLPPATVEVELTQPMFHDLVGLGEAAVAGAADSLMQSVSQNGSSEQVHLAGEQLNAVRQILSLASDVVREARVRVYDDVAELTPEKLIGSYDDQLRSGGWDTVVRVHDGDDNVRVSLVRRDGAVRGVFVMVVDSSDVVLVNVVGDVSPEKVKQLTSAAAKIGLDNGLQQVIEKKLGKLHR